VLGGFFHLRLNERNLLWRLKMAELHAFSMLMMFYKHQESSRFVHYAVFGRR